MSEWRDNGIKDPLMTLEEVAKELGVTRERIRQIETKALRKLRHPSVSGDVRDFYHIECNDVRDKIKHAGKSAKKPSLEQIEEWLPDFCPSVLCGSNK